MSASAGIEFFQKLQMRNDEPELVSGVFSASPDGLEVNAMDPFKGGYENEASD